MDNGIDAVKWNYANRCIDWLLSGDVGVSSEAIFRAMTGKQMCGSYAPSGFSDFGRCYRLLKQFPEWRDRLIEIRNISRVWGKIIDNWDYLCTEYEKIDMKKRESKDKFNAILDKIIKGEK